MIKLVSPFNYDNDSRYARRAEECHAVPAECIPKPKIKRRASTTLFVVHTRAPDLGFWLVRVRVDYYIQVRQYTEVPSEAAQRFSNFDSAEAHTRDV